MGTHIPEREGPGWQVGGDFALQRSTALTWSCVGCESKHAGHARQPPWLVSIDHPWLASYLDTSRNKGVLYCLLFREKERSCRPWTGNERPRGVATGQAMDAASDRRPSRHRFLSPIKLSPLACPGRAGEA